MTISFPPSHIKDKYYQSHNIQYFNVSAVQGTNAQYINATECIVSYHKDIYTHKDHKSKQPKKKNVIFSFCSSDGDSGLGFILFYFLM